MPRKSGGHSPGQPKRLPGAERQGTVVGFALGSEASKEDMIS